MQEHLELPFSYRGARDLTNHAESNVEEPYKAFAHAFVTPSMLTSGSRPTEVRHITHLDTHGLSHIPLSHYFNQDLPMPTGVERIGGFFTYSYRH